MNISEFARIPTNAAVYQSGSTDSGCTAIADTSSGIAAHQESLNQESAALRNGLTGSRTVFWALSQRSGEQGSGYCADRVASSGGSGGLSDTRAH